MSNVPQNDYAGYAEWSDSLTFDEQPIAEYIPNAEFMALIGQAPTPEQPAALTERAARGLEIAVAGGVLSLPGFFHVAGSKGERYAVRFDEAAKRLACECGDWVWRIERALEEGTEPVDRNCKHGHAVEHAISRGLVVDAARRAA